MCAAAAAAPASEFPTLSTATRTPRSQQPARASASLAPSPSDSRKSAIERTPSRSLIAPSQSPASQTVPLPVEITVWKRMPRREPSAFTATLPLWETSATPPAESAISGRSESPQIAERSWTLTMPFPLGPQTGKPAWEATRFSSASSSRPPGTSPKPAETTTAPPQPRSIAASIDAGTAAAGTATASTSTGSGSASIEGKQGMSRTESRPGFTPQS